MDNHGKARIRRYLVQDVVTDIENQTLYLHGQVEFDNGQVNDYYFNCPFNGDAKRIPLDKYVALTRNIQ